MTGQVKATTSWEFAEEPVAKGEVFWQEKEFWYNGEGWGIYWNEHGNRVTAPSIFFDPVD